MSSRLTDKEQFPIYHLLRCILGQIFDECQAPAGVLEGSPTLASHDIFNGYSRPRIPLHAYAYRLAIISSPETVLSALYHLNRIHPLEILIERARSHRAKCSAHCKGPHPTTMPLTTVATSFSPCSSSSSSSDGQRTPSPPVVMQPVVAGSGLPLRSEESIHQSEEEYFRSSSSLSSSLRLSIRNVYRLFLALCLVSSKLHEDLYFSNKTWAETGGVTLKELNLLEVEILKIVPCLMIPSHSFRNFVGHLLQLNCHNPMAHRNFRISLFSETNRISSMNQCLEQLKGEPTSDPTDENSKSSDGPTIHDIPDHYSQYLATPGTPYCCCHSTEVVLSILSYWGKLNRLAFGAPPRPPPAHLPPRETKTPAPPSAPPPPPPPPPVQGTLSQELIAQLTAPDAPVATAATAATAAAAAAPTTSFPLPFTASVTPATTATFSATTAFMNLIISATVCANAAAPWAAAPATAADLYTSAQPFANSQQFADSQPNGRKRRLADETETTAIHRKQTRTPVDSHFTTHCQTCDSFCRSQIAT